MANNDNNKLLRKGGSRNLCFFIQNFQLDDVPDSKIDAPGSAKLIK